MSEIWQAVQTEQAPFNGLPLINYITLIMYATFLFLLATVV